jgi:hypothetical protein
VRTHRIDGVNLFFAVVFIGLGALALVDLEADLDDVQPWLWSGGLVVVGLAGLAATGARMAADRRAERDREQPAPSDGPVDDAATSGPAGAVDDPAGDPGSRAAP